MAGDSAVGQICAAEDGTEGETEAAPQPSEQSVEQIDLKASG